MSSQTQIYVVSLRFYGKAQHWFYERQTKKLKGNYHTLVSRLWTLWCCWLAALCLAAVWLCALWLASVSLAALLLAAVWLTVLLTVPW